MNCKPGDVAVVVKGEPSRNLGRLVTVTHIDAEATREYGSPVWDCDDPDWVYPDECLRPLRDNDGIDEMLRIAGLPHDHKQPQEA